MSRYLYYIILVGLLSTGHNCMAQSEANIANTRVQLKGDKVQITYDILDSNKNAWFLVWVEISDSEGKRLEVKALEGNLGEAQKAGKNKVIMWDPVADSVFLNERLDIQVYANMILPAPPPMEAKSEIQPAKTEDKPMEQQSSSENLSVSNSVKGFKRTPIILQSLALPGLGLSRVTGKPHWIKGVAGYGCIAGAIVFNKKAVTSYESYNKANSQDEANSLFNTTTKQNNISQGLAFTAIAIWAVDLTWTLIGTKDLKKSKTLAYRKGATLDADFDMVSNTPLLSLKYTF